MVVVGVLLLLAKMAEFGPFARWSWWIVAAPFVLAVLWWEFADSSGLTKRREMDKMEQRKTLRRDRALEALGLNSRRNKQVTRAREEAARRVSADPTHGGRDAQGSSASEPAPRRDPRP
jgi:small Trp-rich protein